MVIGGEVGGILKMKILIIKLIFEMILSLILLYCELIYNISSRKRNFIYSILCFLYWNEVICIVGFYL